MTGNSVSKVQYASHQTTWSISKQNKDSILFFEYFNIIYVVFYYITH